MDRWIDSDSAAAIFIMLTIAVLASSIGWPIAWSVAYTDAKVAEMVSAGTDPLGARCAIGNSQTDAVCVVFATRR